MAVFGQLDHVGIVVEDLEGAILFYVETCGLRLLGRERLEAAGLDVAFLDGGGARLELLAAYREGSSIEKFLASRGPGMHHLAWRVPDIHDALLQAVAAGLQPVGDVVRGAGGHLTAFLHPHSTLGTLHELVADATERTPQR